MMMPEGKLRERLDQMQASLATLQTKYDTLQAAQKKERDEERADLLDKIQAQIFALKKDIADAKNPTRKPQEKDESALYSYLFGDDEGDDGDADPDADGTGE